MNTEARLLVEQSLPYIEAFLIEDNSFYPFAMLMNRRMTALPIDPDISEEFPASEYLIGLFEGTIRKELKKINNIYILGIICVDVYIDTDIRGVEFRLFNALEEKKFYLSYSILNESTIVWSRV
ncbi:MAG: hypothetical protein ACK5IJ_06100 [Mangrovibacterium sp.]